MNKNISVLKELNLLRFAILMPRWMISTLLWENFIQTIKRDTKVQLLDWLLRKTRQLSIKFCFHNTPTEPKNMAYTTQHRQVNRMLLSQLEESLTTIWCTKALLSFTTKWFLNK